MHFTLIKNFINKTLKFGCYIPFSNLILNYGNKVLPPIVLDKLFSKRNRKIQLKTAPILKKALSGHYASDNQQYDNKTSDTIWVCWLQGEKHMPEIVRLCLSSIRKNSNGHKVILLTEENYNSFVDISYTITDLYCSGKIKPEHFADLLRINLLAQRGGLWLDATILLTSPIPDIWFQSEFFSIKTKELGRFVSKCRWAVFALACKPESRLLTIIAKAFDEYLEHEYVFVDYFLFDHFIDLLYQKDKNVQQTIDDIPLNNPHVHELNKLLCSDFDNQTYKMLTKDTGVFKLNTRSYSPTELDSNPNSFYAYLKKAYLS